MAETLEDDEELTKVIQWLKSNGPALAAGIVLGLVIIIGWQWWNARIDNRAHAAARLYGSVIQQIERGTITDNVRATIEQLKSEYSGSPYAANVAFRLAAQAVSRHQYDKALTQLDWINEHSDSVPTRNLARVRKARALWAAGQSQQALQLLETQHPDSFDRLYAELTGDIHAALGEQAKAYAAYQRALASLESGVGARILQRKIAQTAPTDAEPMASSATSTAKTSKGA